MTVLPFREVKKYPRLMRHLMYFVKVVHASADADLIFTQDPVSTGLPVVAAAFMNNKKVVIRVPGDYAWEQARQRFGVKDSMEEFQERKYPFGVELARIVQRFVLRRADAIVVPSRYFHDIVSSWPGLSGKVVTIHNGIDLACEFKREPKYPVRTMISAGRLIKGKGFETLIEALVRMKKWNLVLAGDGPEEDSLRTLAKNSGVLERVSFLGRVSRAELFGHIYRSHVFALLSDFETFSFQVVEAMHVGTPVITTNRGALPELVEQGISGVLVEPGNVDNFVQAADQIASDDEYASRLVESAKQKSLEYSFDRTMHALYSIFNKVISK